MSENRQQIADDRGQMSVGGNKRLNTDIKKQVAEFHLPESSII
jgi:hypothetical protein